MVALLKSGRINNRLLCELATHKAVSYTHLQFKVDRAVEKVEKRAPFLKDGGLVLLLGKLIIDVLILDGAGVVAVSYTHLDVYKRQV